MQHLSELEATLRLDQEYLEPEEEAAAINDVEFLAAQTRTRSRHAEFVIKGYELARILRWAVSNYSILNKLVTDGN